MITILIVAYSVQLMALLAVILTDLEEEKGSIHRVIRSKKDVIRFIVPFRWVLVLIVFTWRWWKSLE